MPHFVLGRNYTLRTTDGVISFVKDEETFVGPNMVKHAVAIGAQEVGGKSDVIVETPPKPVAPVGDDRTGQIYAAFELIIEKNDAKEFTGQGVPTTRAMERILGFDLEKGEISQAWASYNKAKAEQ